MTTEKLVRLNLDIFIFIIVIIFMSQRFLVRKGKKMYLNYPLVENLSKLFEIRKLKT